jgi:hypothetical protein
MSLRSPDPTVFRAQIEAQLARDNFVPPPVPDWQLERRAVTTYKQRMVRQLRAIAAVRGYSHAQLAWRLRLSPHQVRRILDGHVALREPERLYRLVRRLDPATEVSAPDSIPTPTRADREEIDAQLRAKIEVSLANPGPGYTTEEVWAHLDALRRELRPMTGLAVAGQLTHARYVATYAHDPDADLYHGEVTNLRDVVTFQARELAGLEAAFAASVADYEAFCRETAA